MSNRAQPQRLLGRDRPFRLTPAALCRAGISSLRRTGSVWVWRLNGRVLGLAAAGMRSGARSWELSGLYLREDRSGDPRELLERVSQTAASLGAERVFLRLRSGDPLIHTARAAGYYPRIGEVLYRHAGPASVTQAPVASYVDRKRIRLADRADRMDLVPPLLRFDPVGGTPGGRYVSRSVEGIPGAVARPQNGACAGRRRRTRGVAAGC